MANYRLDTDHRHPKYFDLLPNFNPGKIPRGWIQMSRLFSLAVGAALVAVAVMFCLTGFAEAQVKPADPGLLPELSLYAGSKSCIECRGDFAGFSQTAARLCRRLYFAGRDLRAAGRSFPGRGGAPPGPTGGEPLAPGSGQADCSTAEIEQAGTLKKARHPPSPNHTTGNLET